MDSVIAIFVARFDVHGGNTIEKSFPPGLDLSGVEFKAIASGFHLIESDIVYFRKVPYYGVSVYRKRTFESGHGEVEDREKREERGARMKAVGILSTNYQTLHLHIPFLQQQAMRVLEDGYSEQPLMDYLESQRGLKTPEMNKFLTSDVPDLKLITPIGEMHQFVLYFGPAVFSLWKLVLLKSRILFYSPPPVEIACYRVYSACLLGKHQIPIEFEIGSDPLFYVELNDIDYLGTLDKYVACTSEKIFETKKKSI